ncbi:YhcN/YlaJ family sporulation lipoprotein [Aureibacillus halotolerans]|uniref:YhcN/YlaJ family sporulation lipoprotein n=1 Tax=Aureibacillus halotolerans TaxID=1508390 RepID=A0A4R6U4Q5_9BACI|nr:YhcN/YlaJ family sporulation lipoprotein [Aureibacillus halotolerans]TDQ40482.1 YhcN/YlaJ family sporulation lipoprotein [Aureibacillus halotolerans]
MDKRILRYVLSGAAAAALLTGCANGSTDNGEQSLQRNSASELRQVRYDNNRYSMRYDNAQDGQPGLRRMSETNNDVDMNNERFRVAEKASEKVTELEEVEDATVVVTNHNAFVGVKLKDGNENAMSSETKKKVADKVREADNSIERVYVSANADFLDRLQGYVTDIENGKPISGFVDEFNETIQRIFPKAQ